MRKLLTICCAAAVLLLGSTEGYAFDAEDLEKLKSTGSCPHCDLQSADLRGAFLGEFKQSHLELANLRRNDLEGANLQGADLRKAYLFGAKLDSDDLAMAKGQGAIGLDPSGSDVAKAVPEKPKPAKRVAQTAVESPSNKPSQSSDPVIGALYERPEGYICRYALGRTTRGYTGAAITPEWSSRNRNFVKEAKRRGLTVIRCFQLLSAQFASVGSTKTDVKSAKQVTQQRHVVAFDVFKQQRRATGTQGAVANFGDFQIRIDFDMNTLEFPLRFKRRDKLPQVFVLQGTLPGWRMRRVSGALID